VACLVAGVSIKEDGTNGWEDFAVWSGFAIVAAAATLAPSFTAQLNLTRERALPVATAGAVALSGFWILFVLPSITRNTSFLATLGCAAGALAAWTAPGREPSVRPPTW
jgi:hypothetical protein